MQISEKNKNTLKRAYTGLLGLKVFWLATFTFFPVLLALKIDWIQVKLSPATVIYFIYHAFGITVWNMVRQLASGENYTIEVAEEHWKKAWKLHHWVVRLLLVPVVLLLLLTLLAKMSWQWGNHGVPIKLPNGIYYITGVLKPERNICTRIEEKLESIRRQIENNKQCSFPVISKVISVQNADDCSKTQICIVDQKATEANRDKMTPMKEEIFTDLYAAENRNLISRLDKSHDDVQRQQPRFSQLGLLHAPAGTGKSFFFRGYYKQVYESKNRPTVVMRRRKQDVSSVLRQEDLREWFEEHKLNTPDLSLNGRVINQLVGATSNDTQIAKMKETIGKLLASPEGLPEELRNLPEIIVLDSLDEIAENVRKLLFKELHYWLSDVQGRHVYVLGRPESLSSRDRETSTTYRLTGPHKLRSPQYTDAREVAIRWNNWLLWKWSENRTVPIHPSSQTKFEDILRLMRKSWTVCESFSHLTTSGMIISQGKEWLNKEHDTRTEEHIQKMLLDSLLERNNQTHGRPSPVDSRDYVKYLGTVALKVEFSNDGEFRVPYDAMVDDSSSRTTQRKLLNHSGLIDLNPVGENLYQFYPKWVPLELLRRLAEQENCTL